MTPAIDETTETIEAKELNAAMETRTYVRVPNVEYRTARSVLGKLGRDWNYVDCSTASQRFSNSHVREDGPLSRLTHFVSIRNAPPI
ncbi:hypothetical protein [Paraburkholderia hospita]|uniref:hypothetical protein n=1 Tax=Paraburkholderia hospita TaxID=169430 RepID=UPI000B34339C|nr:hypothetical protein [Paraburkholderia hospita]